MGTIPLASASSKVVVRLPEEKGVTADVNQSFCSAPPSPAGLDSSMHGWECAKEDSLILLHVEVGTFFLFSYILFYYVMK